MAPFPDEDKDNPNIIPQAYILSLFPGYTISDLSAAVSQGIQKPVKSVEEIPGAGLGIFIVLHDVDDDLLATIRTHKGVRG